MYNWQQSDWPNFNYETSQIDELLTDFAQKYGKSTGLLEALSDDSQQEAVIELMVAEAIKTSRLKINISAVRMSSQLMVSVRENHDKSLTKEMLFNWHKMIMKGSKGINAGKWRTHEGPMQVVSGSISKETVLLKHLLQGRFLN